MSNKLRKYIPIQLQLTEGFRYSIPINIIQTVNANHLEEEYILNNFSSHCVEPSPHTLDSYIEYYDIHDESECRAITVAEEKLSLFWLLGEFISPQLRRTSTLHLTRLTEADGAVASR